MNSMKIGTYQMDTTFGLYLPEYTIPAPAVQTNFVKIIGRDGSVDLSNALGLHYDSRTWSLDFKCFDPTVNWHTLSSQVMNAIHGKRLNFEFDDDPNYFWTGRVSVQNYVSSHGTGTLKVTIVSDPFKYAKLSTIVTKTASTGTDYTGSMVTFNDGLIYDLSADIEPIQDLHGYSSPWIGTDYDQQPYNFRAVSSSSVSPLGNSEMGNIVGGTVAWNQLIQNGNFADTDKWLGVQATISAADGILKLTVTGTQTYAALTNERSNKKATLNHKMLMCATLKSNTTLTNNCDFAIHVGNYQQTSSKFSLTANTSTRISKLIDVNSNTAAGTQNMQFQFWTPHTGAAAGIEVEYSNVVVFDLTAMFGSTIADYIYGLEQNTEGAGVAWFKKLFPKDYYAYDAGTLLSVKTTAHKEVGFNQWDEQWEVGDINNADGQNTSADDRIRSKNYISVLPGATYYFKMATGINARLFFYGIDKSFIRYTDVSNTTFTPGTGEYYVRFRTFVAYGTTYKNDICINLHWDGERDGEYEPYEANTYALDDVELRGIPKLDASNNLYYDGDSYAPDGTVTRKYGIVDLGTLNWMKYSGTTTFFYVQTSAWKETTYNCLCSKYQTYRGSPISDKYLSFNGNILRCYDSAYDESDADTFKVAMNGVYLVYELATPTTESAEPYTSPQSIDQYGTEEYVDAGVAAGTRDVAIPVGHYTNYANICPISGRTGLSVYVGPTQDPDDATTYSVDWTTPAGTVYGGTLDVVTGVLTVDKVLYTYTGNESVSARSGNYIPVKLGASGIYVTNDGICTDFEHVRVSANGWSYIQTTMTPAEVQTYLQNHTVSIVCELATPLTYQLTAQEVEALVGTNNVWSDGGNVTVAVVTPETLTNNGRAVVPTLTASADMVLKWGNYSASVQQGTSTIPQLILENGANLIYIIGTGSISFTWQEVSL